MTVALLLVELHLSQARSLKEKRMVLNRITARLRDRFNLAVAEVDHQDLWQRTALAVVTVNNSKDHATRTLESAEREIEHDLPGEVLSTSVEYLG